jgi:phenylacetate-CoA ligase
MPVIRYRTCDLTCLLPGTTTSMRRMERVRGRSDDMLIIRGVNLFPSQVESVLMQEPGLAPHYFLEVRREGRLDEVDVHIERRVSTSADDCAGLGRRAEHLLKAHIGVTTRVRVAEPGTIERSQGKAKRVRDLRPKA